MSWWWLTFNLIAKPTSHDQNLDQKNMKQNEVFALVTRTESRKPALRSVKLMVQTYLNPGLSIIQHEKSVILKIQHNMET